MDFKLLKKLYSIHSKSGQEGQIISFIYRWVKTNVPEAEIECDTETGNLYIRKGDESSATNYPCIVAHMDQVQTYHPKDFVAVETRDIIFGYSPKDRKQCGLGADDKNGVWIALQCLQKYDNIKIAFFVGEEVGCLGSEKAKINFFKDVRFVLEPDRRGHSDMITEISFEELCSKEFINAVKPKKYGYKITSGLMTDIETLKENGLDVSCINLSCGYYEPHTDKEFTVKKDLIKCLRIVEHIIEDCTDVYPHISIFEDGGCYGHYGRDMFLYDDYYDELYDIIYTSLSSDATLQPMDIFEQYKDLFPGLTIDDVAMIYEDAKNSIEFFKKDKAS